MATRTLTQLKKEYRLIEKVAECHFINQYSFILNSVLCWLHLKNKSGRSLQSLERK